MNRFVTRLLASSALALGLCAVTAQSVQAADWSDTFIGFRYGTTFKEPQPPGSPNQGNITKEIIQLQHVSGYAYGTNFFNVDMLHSNMADKATLVCCGSSTGSGYTGSGGANEVYVAYAHNLSLGKVFAKDMSFGPVKDVGLKAGFDFNAKDGGIAPAVRKYMVGPSFQFAVPSGFLTAAVTYYYEHNHNQFANYGSNPQPDISFSSYQLSTAFMFPVASVGAKFQGWATYTGPKGKDYNGTETKPEFLTELGFLFDVGRFAGKKETFYVGPGYQYWHNKFGTDANTFSGASASVWQLEAEAHF